MALQELSRPPVETGYSQLGATLSGIGDRIGQQRRQDELLAQARAQQLADYDRTRAAQLADYDKVRAAQLSDQATHRGEFLADVASTRTEGDRVYGRNRTDLLNDQAVARTYTLDDREDARTWSEISANLDLARKARERAPFEKDLKKLVNTAAQNLRLGQDQTKTVSAIIESEPRVYQATDPDVRNNARIAAGSPDKKLVEQMIPAVLERMNGMELFRHADRVKTARMMLETIKAANKEWTDIIQSGLLKNVAPDESPPPRIEPSPANGASVLAPPARAATAADLNAAASAVSGVSPVPLASRPSPEALPPPAAVAAPLTSVNNGAEVLSAPQPQPTLNSPSPGPRLISARGRVPHQVESLTPVGADWTMANQSTSNPWDEILGQMWMKSQLPRSPIGRPITTGPMIFPTPVR